MQKLKEKELFLPIGELVKSHRQEKKMTQKELAKKTGINKCQYISSIERGKVSIPNNKLGLFCAILDIPTSEMRRVFLSGMDKVLSGYLTKSSADNSEIKGVSSK